MALVNRRMLLRARVAGACAEVDSVRPNQPLSTIASQLVVFAKNCISKSEIDFIARQHGIELTGHFDAWMFGHSGYGDGSGYGSGDGSGSGYGYGSGYGDGSGYGYGDGYGYATNICKP